MYLDELRARDRGAVGCQLIIGVLALTCEVARVSHET